MQKLHFKSICTALATLVLHSCSHQPAYANSLMPIRWTADAAKNEAFVTQIGQGETRELQVTLKNYGASVTIPPTATAFMWYQTNGMDSLYFPGGAATVTTGGVVTAKWTPALDVGASAYSFAIDIRVGSNAVYTPYGNIRMRKTPGWVPNTLPLPELITVIDFDLITPLNAPWPTFEVVSNLIGSIEGAGGGTIVVEVDPEAKPIAEEALALAQAAVPIVDNVGIAPVLRAQNIGGRFSFLAPTSLWLFGSQYGGEILISPSGWYRAVMGITDFSVAWPTSKDGSPLATHSDIAIATNAAITSIFSLQNAMLIVSNEVASITTNGVPIWSSASGGGSVPPSVTNELWQSISALQSTVSSLQSSLAGISRDWGSYAPDGSVNPDPYYMLYINRPATVWASGFQWATSGGHAVLSTTGMVAFAVGDSGEMRIGPGDGTNYFGFVQGGSVEIGANAGGITVADEVATILYPYESGAFPVLWFTPDLALAFEPMPGVVWVDNADGTATVTAPATTDKGFWRATTSATYTAEFRSTMPARFTGGVFGATNAVPVIYDSTIQISSGGKTYRIPAEEL